MKKLVAVAVLATLLIGLAPVPVHAGGAVNAALALGAFAVLSPFLLLGALVQPFYAQPYYGQPYYPQPYHAPAAPAYASVPAYPVGASAPAARPPAIQREVVYAQGRHVLLGDGVTSAYQWVWVPNPPAGTPPAPPSR